MVLPVVEYACQVYHGALTKEQSSSIEAVQERALKIIMPDASYDLAMQIADIHTLADRRVQLCKTLFIEIQNPSHRLHHLLPKARENSHTLRSSQTYEPPNFKTDRTRASFINWCLYNLQ